MAPIPVCSGDEACRAFERLGWEKRRKSGSHVILVKGGVPAILSIPRHSELDRGTLRALIRRAGITVDEFVAALRG